MEPSSFRTCYLTFCSLSFLDEHYGEQFYLIELWWGPNEFIHRKSPVLSMLSLKPKEIWISSEKTFAQIHPHHPTLLLQLKLDSSPSRTLKVKYKVWHKKRCATFQNSHLIFVMYMNINLGYEQEWAVSVCDHGGGANNKESTCNTGDLGSIPVLGRSPRRGHSNPLQYSCLENPMDRGACWVTVHEVTHSQTWLKQLSTHACRQSWWEKTWSWVRSNLLM